MFGRFFITQENWRSRYIATAKKDTYCAILHRKGLNRVLDRMDSKKLALDLKFLKTIPQFQKMNKKTLQKFAKGHKELRIKRNQTLIKEGDPPEFLYVLKEGLFKVSKHMYKDRKSEENFEFQLLNQNPTVAQRYRSNFGARFDLKKEMNLPLMIIGQEKRVDNGQRKNNDADIGQGKMVGDFEAVNGLKNVFTIICDSQEGVVYRIKREDALRFLQTQDEAMNQFKAASKEVF
jgi:CRP-like cAMP-binding protein